MGPNQSDAGRGRRGIFGLHCRKDRAQVSDTDQGQSITAMAAAKLAESLESRPLTTVAGLAGVGYVLARGMPDFVLRIGASVALRTAMAQLADSIVQDRDGHLQGSHDSRAPFEGNGARSASQASGEIFREPGEGATRAKN